MVLLVFKLSKFHVSEVSVNVCDEAFAGESVLLGANVLTYWNSVVFKSVLVQSSR